MSTGDTRPRDRILRLRAAEAELHGRPGEAVVFRLSLFNGLVDSEVFSYPVDALDGDFDGDLRAPEGAVGPGQTVEIELELEILEGVAPGRYAFRIAAVLSRDNTIGVAQDLVVRVGASRASVLPLVAGAVGAIAIALVGLFLLTQIGSGGDSKPGLVLGATATPTITVRPSPAASATAVSTPTPTTRVIESPTPTVRVTEEPTQTATSANSAPNVRIASPADGQLYCPGPPNGQGSYTAEIELQGDVSDAEDGVLPNDQISWTFALDGEEPQFFSESAMVSLEIHASGTTYKTVDVGLEATDSEGLSSQSTVHLFVGGPQAEACLNPATTPLR